MFLCGCASAILAKIYSHLYKIFPNILDLKLIKLRMAAQVCEGITSKVWNAQLQTNLYACGGPKLYAQEGKKLEDPTMYQQLVGSLIYLTLT